VIVHDLNTNQQRFLMGHSSPICVMTASSNGLLATAQEGRSPVVRIWDVERMCCLAYLTGHFSDIVALAFSGACHLLAVVGKDAHGRNLIIIWSTHEIFATG
jgi:WD40 repeat protein